MLGGGGEGLLWATIWTTGRGDRRRGGGRGEEIAGGRGEEQNAGRIERGERRDREGKKEGELWPANGNGGRSNEFSSSSSSLKSAI